MLMEQATAVRKEWSAVCDNVIHEKPKFIKRTRDKMWFSNLETMFEILSAYKFTKRENHASLSANGQTWITRKKRQSRIFLVGRCMALKNSKI